MAVANTWGDPAGTVGTLNGLFKETYADKLEELIPDGVKLINMIKFMSKDKQPGNLYHQPVILGMEHGVTFANSDDDAFNLLAPVAGTIKDAQIKGYPMLLRSVLGLVAASRAAQGGSKSFMDATKFLVQNMLRSMARKLEIELFYGQIGYATVASTTGSVITITTAEWAPGIWAGAEGMPLEIRSANGATSRGTFKVLSVDMNLQTITLTTAVPGSVVATDVIWHLGAYGNEFPGIQQILTQATGLLFNIDTGVYNLWRGNIYPANSGSLSFSKLNAAVAYAVEKGLDTKLCAYINVRAWSNLLNDQAALRRYDSSYSAGKVELGSKSIMFHSQNGDLEIEPSIFVKQGYAFLLEPDVWFRVGSTDMTFKRPGQGDEFFRDQENAAGYELRLYTDQALFCTAPGHNVIVTGIVNA
jgi:hypothetical protein